MRRRPGTPAPRLLLVLAAVAGLAGATVAPAAGVQAVRRTVAPQADPAAVLLLARAVDAEGTTPYAGTQVLSQWGAAGTTSGVMTVAHRPGKGTVMGVAPTGGGAGAVGGQVLLAVDTRGADLRAPDAVSGIALGRSAVALAGAHPVAGVAPDGPSLELVRRHYDLRTAGAASALGRPARVVEARRPDVTGAGAVAARFWLDDGTGLLVRRESYDTDGALTRSSSFVDLRLGMAVGPATPAGPLTARVPSVGESVGERLDETGLRRAAAEGFWTGSDLPDGLERHDARARLPDGTRMVHLAFSDGLSSVSVFQQHGRLDGVPQGWRTERVAGYAVLVQDEPPQRVAWQSGDLVVTVVGDLGPRGTADVVSALPHARADGDGGLTARLDRGLERVGGWFGG